MKMTIKTHLRCLTYRIDAEQKKIEQSKRGKQNEIL